MRHAKTNSTTARKSTLSPTDFSRLIDELESRTSRELSETRARFHTPRVQNNMPLMGFAFAA